MASIINLTSQQTVVVTVPASSGTSPFFIQPLLTVIDVAAFDFIDLQLGVLYNNTGVSLWFGLATSMQVDTLAGWMNASATTVVSGLKFSQQVGTGSSPTNAYQVQAFGSMAQGGNLLRYIGWMINPTASTVPGGDVAFWMRGMARRIGTG